jgi:hypothetical protein
MPCTIRIFEWILAAHKRLWFLYSWLYCGYLFRAQVLHLPWLLKRTLADNIYYLGAAKQVADYETTTEFLVNYIKKIYNFGSYIGTALDQLQEFDTTTLKPTLILSNNSDAFVKETMDEKYKI